MSDFVQVITTTGGRDEAREICNSLVRDDLVGCAQFFGPVESIYQWEGGVENSEEWMCFLKTRKELFEKVEERIKEIHSYENPEIVSLEIDEGSEEYLEWLSDVIQG